MSKVVRSLVFPVDGLPVVLIRLLKEFRLIVNKSIRAALVHGARSRYRLTSLVYRRFSAEHEIYKKYIPSAFEVAMICVKGYRRSISRGRSASIPYMRRLALKADNKSYRLDRQTGRVRIPIRADGKGSIAECVELDLTLSAWHRSLLADSSWGLGSLTLTPTQIIVTIRKASPPPYNPQAVIALDTNESSLDGVVAKGDDAALISVPFSTVRIVQATHFRRSRWLGRKKAHDRRMKRHLLAREGRRERARVKQRLHLVSKGLVEAAKDRRAAIVLEDLTLHGAGGRSRRTNRRLSSWPRGELHRQIEYKSLAAGVPLIKIDPKYTSKTCPQCMTRLRRRERVGQVFECRKKGCGWKLDRQHNAGLNILNTALAAPDCADLARAVRFRPAALRKDEMIRLYDLPPMVTGVRGDRSGVEVSCGLMGDRHGITPP